MNIPYDLFEKAGEAVTPVENANLVPCDGNRILIVDDETRIREVFKIVLADGLPECTVDAAGNGQEALDLFTQGHQGVLIMDLHMSVMDGQAAFLNIEKLCKERGWEMPSVVFCTGFAHPQTVRSVVVRNSTHCLLSKPVRGETLLSVVKARLDARKGTPKPPEEDKLFTEKRM